MSIDSYKGWLLRGGLAAFLVAPAVAHWFYPKSIDLTWPVIVPFLAASFVVLMPFIKELRFPGVSMRLRDRSDETVRRIHDLIASQRELLSLPQQMQTLGRYDLPHLRERGLITPSTESAALDFLSTSKEVLNYMPWVDPAVIESLELSGQQLVDLIQSSTGGEK